jgi:hypothetical protein
MDAMVVTLSVHHFNIGLVKLAMLTSRTPIASVPLHCEVASIVHTLRG